MPIRRALFVGCERLDIEPFAEMLSKYGVALAGDADCAARLRKRNVPVSDIGDWAADPSAPAEAQGLDGRLHAALGANVAAGVQPIDMLFVQLPAAPSGATPSEVRAHIDLSRVALVRTAIRHGAAILIDGGDIPDVGGEFFKGADLSEATRERLAAKAMGMVARYEAEVAAAMAAAAPDDPLFPASKALSLDRVGVLRTHDRRGAALYAPRQTQRGTLGEALIYGSGPDAMPSGHLARELDAAAKLAGSFTEPALVLWARGRPVAVTVAASVDEAFAALSPQLLRLLSEPILASNTEITPGIAAAIAGSGVAAIVAPSFDNVGLPAMQAREGLVIVALRDRPPETGGMRVTSLNGAYLLEEPYAAAAGEVTRGQVLSQRAPTPAELRTLEIAWTVASHAPSDAVVLARADERGAVRTIGIAAGAISRRQALEMALAEAGGNAAGAVIALDSTLVDQVEVDAILQRGVLALAHPGGPGDAALVLSGTHVLAWIATGRAPVR